MSFIIALEGNIGSGKSTLLQDLSKDYIVVPENITEWIKSDLLNQYYNNKTRYSYLFQSFVLISRLSEILNTIKNNPDKIIICERCHLSDMYIFVDHLFSLSEISELEYSVYQNLHTLISSMISIPLKGIIYNQTLPQICLERIHQRDRSGENLISLDYIEKLHQKHEYFIEHVDYPVLTIDGNIDYNDSDKRQMIIQNIYTFIQNLKE
jgi:deoxycitidine kinase